MNETILSTSISYKRLHTAYRMKCKYSFIIINYNIIIYEVLYGTDRHNKRNPTVPDSNAYSEVLHSSLQYE